MVQHAGVLAAEDCQCGLLRSEPGIQCDGSGAWSGGARYLGEAPGADPGQGGGARGHRGRAGHQVGDGGMTSDDEGVTQGQVISQTKQSMLWSWGR